MNSVQIRLFADESCTVPVTTLVGGIDYEGSSFSTLAEPTVVYMNGKKLTRTSGAQTTPSSDTFGWQNYVCYLPNKLVLPTEVAYALHEAQIGNPIYLANLSSATIHNLTIRNAYNKSNSKIIFRVNNELFEDYCTVSQLSPNQKISIYYEDSNSSVNEFLGLVISYEKIVGNHLNNPQELSTVTFPNFSIRKTSLVNDDIYILLDNFELYKLPFGTSSTELIDSNVRDIFLYNNMFHYVKSDGQVRRIVDNSQILNLFVLPDNPINAMAWYGDNIVVVSNNRIIVYSSSRLQKLNVSSEFYWNGLVDVEFITPNLVALNTGYLKNVVFYNIKLNSYIFSYSVSNVILGIESIGNWLIISQPNSVDIFDTREFINKKTVIRELSNTRVLSNKKQRLLFVDGHVIDLNSRFPCFFGFYPQKIAWLDIGKGVFQTSDVIKCYRV